MKITISKSQWEEMGKKAGWMKEAELSKSVVPIEEIIGTSPNGTANQIDQDMHSKGYFLFRENFPWGRTLAYRNEKGDKVYLDHNLEGQHVWMTWDQLKEVLRRDWRPVNKQDQDWFIANLG